ncbi:VOC family protein [Tepidicaulis sp. LMO-SS28]|uniref:VOC family protein n=1 Tax=Tepidicaulis sp. LMO-SS28 TaxID=3447455 RepID=UPI003EE1FD69
MTQSRSFPAFTHIALHVADLDKSAAFYTAFCGLETVHRRDDDGIRVFWLAEPGEAKHFVIVLIEGGNPDPQKKGDISHLGFALESKEAVDKLAEKAGEHLAWPPKQLPPPTGYFCGLKDPDGRVVEFSYGQPLGPGYEA